MGQSSLSATLAQERDTLAAEERGLKETLELSRKNRASTESALEAEIASLTKTLVTLRTENASYAETFAEREQMRSLSDQKTLIADTVVRTLGWGVSKGFVTRAPVEPTPEQAAEALSDLGRTLAARNLPQRSESDVFESDGLAKRVALIRVGPVAAFALEGDLATPTEPVEGGLGYRRMAPPQRIKNTGAFVIAPVVLFDPDAPHEHAPEEARGFGAWLEQGGFSMYPLLLMALFALLVAFERFITLLRVQWLWRGVTPSATLAAKAKARATRHWALLPVRVALSDDGNDAEDDEDDDDDDDDDDATTARGLTRRPGHSLGARFSHSGSGAAERPLGSCGRRPIAGSAGHSDGHDRHLSRHHRARDRRSRTFIGWHIASIANNPVWPGHRHSCPPLPCCPQSLGTTPRLAS